MRILLAPLIPGGFSVHLRTGVEADMGSRGPLELARAVPENLRIMCLPESQNMRSMDVICKTIFPGFRYALSISTEAPDKSVAQAGHKLGSLNPQILAPEFPDRMYSTIPS